MSLHQIIYSSRPFGFDEATLSNILLDARTFNAQRQITGALICRQDIYLQLLEGPERAILSLYDRICVDDRHTEVLAHLSGPIEVRLFPRWWMLHDPARSWLWSQAEIADDKHHAADPDAVFSIFRGLARSVADQAGDATGTL